MNKLEHSKQSLRSGELKQITEDILKHMNVRADVLVTEETVGEEAVLNVTIEGDDLSFLIGYRGESLDGLQTVLSLILNKQSLRSDEPKGSNVWQRVVTDINGYRKQRQDKIEEITKGYIDRVRFLTKEIEMPPMTSAERRYVHMFVSAYTDVVTESVGEGASRRVVLKPAVKKPPVSENR